jgi:hypothetical protein
MKNTLKFVSIMAVGLMLGTASCDNDDDNIIGDYDTTGIDTTGTPGIDTTGTDTTGVPGTDTTGTDTTGIPTDTTGIDTTGTPGIDTTLINSLRRR